MSAGRGLGKVKYMSQPKLSVWSVYRGMKGKRDRGEAGGAGGRSNTCYRPSSVYALFTGVRRGKKGYRRGVGRGCGKVECRTKSGACSMHDLLLAFTCLLFLLPLRRLLSSSTRLMRTPFSRVRTMPRSTTRCTQKRKMSCSGRQRQSL